VRCALCAVRCALCATAAADDTERTVVILGAAKDDEAICVICGLLCL
jgi:hypothetical protein